MATLGAMARSISSRNSATGQVLAAIDVGTNALRLELVRMLPDGTLLPLLRERTPVRLGEGLYERGLIRKDAADRLIATLRRYAALCDRFGAKVRAVATSAMREAKNRGPLLARIRRETGLELEVITGAEEARLICLGILQGSPALARSLCIDIGGGSTEVAFAIGPRPKQLWSAPLGAVRLTELFDARGKISKQTLELLRRYSAQALEEALPARIAHAPKVALGSGGTIGALVGFVTQGRKSTLDARQLTRAIEQLASMPLAQRSLRLDPKRAEVIVSGAVILEALFERLGITSVRRVDEGLREGVLVDLLGQVGVSAALEEEALQLGQRFGFDEAHGRQVEKLSLWLFDQLAALHQLPSTARRLLSVAALLHDLGTVVSYSKHHRHTQYLLRNAELSGLDERDRNLLALIARFHRRSPPERSHPELGPLSDKEFRLVRRCSSLLRVADALDRGHRQRIKALRCALGPKSVRLELRASGSVDLELWDLEREAGLFGEVFDRRLRWDVGLARRRRP